MQVSHRACDFLRAEKEQEQEQEQEARCAGLLSGVV